MSLEATEYNSNSMVVRVLQGDREEFAPSLKQFRARWNARLKGGPGWTVPMENKDALLKFISTMKKGGSRDLPSKERRSGHSRESPKKRPSRRSPPTRVPERSPPKERVLSDSDESSDEETPRQRRTSPKDLRRSRDIERSSPSSLSESEEEYVPPPETRGADDFNSLALQMSQVMKRLERLETTSSRRR